MAMAMARRATNNQFHPLTPIAIPVHCEPKEDRDSKKVLSSQQLSLCLRVGGGRFVARKGECYECNSQEDARLGNRRCAGCRFRIDPGNRDDLYPAFCKACAVDVFYR
ncbi:hypothetical protein IG631_21304 [Alternaria alternata]|nr:hypothetical protein IG631_21304 [Alternaria alternata]